MTDRIAINGVVNETKLDIVESSAPRSKMVLRTVKGPFSVAESVCADSNRNRRLYSESLLRNKIVESPYTKEMIANKSLFGEIAHPVDRSDIDLNKVSHCITSLTLKEGVVYGTADILDTPAGRIMDTLVEYGSVIGISSRGSGTLIPEGAKTRVQESDYIFTTYDFVPCPGFDITRVHTVNESYTLVDASIPPLALEKIQQDVEHMGNMELVTVKSLLEYSENSGFSGIIQRIDERLVRDCPIIEKSSDTTHFDTLSNEVLIAENTRLLVENALLEEATSDDDQDYIVALEHKMLEHQVDNRRLVSILERREGACGGETLRDIVNISMASQLQEAMALIDTLRSELELESTVVTQLVEAYRSSHLNEAVENTEYINSLTEVKKNEAIPVTEALEKPEVVKAISEPRKSIVEQLGLTGYSEPRSLVESATSGISVQVPTLHEEVSNPEALNTPVTEGLMRRILRSKSKFGEDINE